MCGICGIIHDNPQQPIQRAVLEAMNRSMMHRGPDDEGYHIGPGVGLAMRRLSIIDVSGGHQPFSDERKNIVAVCNGELYNFQEQRAELIARGHAFHSRSDVEILPHLYEECGENLTQKIFGMFGLAVWDERQRKLLLARDRMGKKPLYYARIPGGLVFGSELKAILAHPDITRKIDHISLSKYLAYEYVPAPHSIFDGIVQLDGAEQLSYANGRIDVRRYWNPPDQDLAPPLQKIAEEILRVLLLGAVERRLMSDVPLGVFLSGGIDSSSVVAAMCQLRDPKQIKTFSIGFAEKTFDESSYARLLAQQFGTDHRERLCTPSDLLALLPEMTSVLDEPLGDASIIPTYALSKFTREHVTVALGGDGGDELFAGYPTFQAERIAAWYQHFPRVLRSGIIEPLVRALPVSDENISFDFKLKQFIKGANAHNARRHLLWMGSFAPDELPRLLGRKQAIGDVFDDVPRIMGDAPSAEAGNRLLYFYQRSYLQNDILVKVDRASMAASLECRAPLLDTQVVEFVARLPYAMKLDGWTLKALFKRAMAPWLPELIRSRAKKGFGVPVAKWLKGPLRLLMEDMLSEQRLREQGILDPQFVRRLVDEHVSGKKDHRKQLWTLLMLQLWHQRWMERTS